MLAAAVQNHIAVTGHGMGLGGAYPLPGQPQGLILLETGARQQVDDEGALEALGQGLIEGAWNSSSGLPSWLNRSSSTRS